MKIYKRWMVCLLIMALVLSGCGNSGKNAENGQLAGIQKADAESGQEHADGGSGDSEAARDGTEEGAGTGDSSADGTAQGTDSKDKDGAKDASADGKGSENGSGDSAADGAAQGAGDPSEKDGKTKEPEAPALNKETAVYSREEVVTTSSVNVRTAPSTDSEVYQTAARRSEFVRTADDGTWSAVELDGKEYYVASEYLMLKSEMKDNGFLVVIDAGHQGKGNSEQEPIGPGASETKAKVASGTSGCVTGLNEYELTLSVSLKLQAELEARGYQVVMVRTSHDVNISNSERAAVANNAGADAFIRVHANGSDDSSENGILTICPTSSNPFMGSLYSQCRSLSECVLDGAVNAMQGKWQSD